uniref:Uncharacterized protein n=1 Tax=Anguilla anguilla TaxID=7936 RepID=A0A0E9Q4F9_ANGAN
MTWHNYPLWSRIWQHLFLKTVMMRTEVLLCLQILMFHFHPLGASKYICLMEF